MTTDCSPHRVARTPEDLLAFVPLVLGFHPVDSLVMVTANGAGRPFHARIDLPRRATTAAVAATVAPLRAAAADQGVTQACFLLYTADRRLAARVAARIEHQFADLGVLGTLRAHDGRWWPIEAGSEGSSRAYDVELHPFALEAVVAGTVVHRGREGLVATVARDPAGSETVGRVLAGLPPLSRGRPREEDLAWVVALVDGSAADDRATDDQIARLVRLLGHLEVRDEVWLRLTRSRAPALVPWWCDVVRRTPDEVVAEPAFLLGFTAWLAGHGALAWCAVDRCRDAHPGHRAADLLAGLLHGAVPPTDWAELGDHQPPSDEGGMP